MQAKKIKIKTSHPFITNKESQNTIIFKFYTYNIKENRQRKSKQKKIATFYRT